MDWSRIRKIFQIPLSWFIDVDRRSWIIPDGQHINVERTKDGTLISFDPTGLEGDTSDCVKLTGAQTVAGAKTFTSNVVTDNGTNKNIVGNGNLMLDRSSGFYGVVWRTYAGVEVAKILFAVSGARLILCAGGVANKVTLDISPNVTASDTSSLAVATCGWVAGKFAAKGEYAPLSHSHGNITSEGKLPNAAACFVTTDITGKIIQFSSSDLPIANAKAVVNAFTVSGNTAKLDESSVDFGTGVTNVTSENLADQAEDAGLLTEDDIPAETVSALSSASSQGTTSLDIVTAVTWSSSTGTFQKTTRTLTIKNGIITGIGNATTATIDTPTVISWT